MKYNKLVSEDINVATTKQPHYPKKIQNKFFIFEIILVSLIISCIIISSILIYYLTANKKKSNTIALLLDEVNDLKQEMREFKFQNQNLVEQLLKMEENQKKLPSQGIPSFISNDDMEVINSLFPGKTIKLTTLYQPKIDGDSKEDFKKNLKGVPGLLFVIETQKGVKIGAYVNTICDDYNSNSGIYAESDPNAFLFSITKKKVYTVKNRSHAKQCRNDYLITFNSDLMINDGCLHSVSSSEFPTNYNTPNKDGEKNELLDGESYFYIRDMVVLKLIFK